MFHNKITLLLLLGLYCVVGINAKDIRNGQRIVGGDVTTIDEYPQTVVMLYNFQGTNDYIQECGGVLITTSVVMSAAHCFVVLSGEVHATSWWRVRAGSTYAHSGGIVLPVSNIRVHEEYNIFTEDIALLKTLGQFTISNVIRPASIATNLYTLPDDASVWAVGWGTIYQFGPKSEQLQHVELKTIAQATCNDKYNNIITNSMLCIGLVDVGGRDQCQGDNGGPLFHNGVVVGIASWGSGCADPNFPGVNTRVSSFTSWIRNNLAVLK